MSPYPTVASVVTVKYSELVRPSSSLNDSGWRRDMLRYVMAKAITITDTDDTRASMARSRGNSERATALISQTITRVVAMPTMMTRTVSPTSDDALTGAR